MGRPPKEETVIVEELMEVQAKMLERKTPLSMFVFKKLRSIQIEISRMGKKRTRLDKSSAF